MGGRARAKTRVRARTRAKANGNPRKTLACTPTVICDESQSWATEVVRGRTRACGHAVPSAAWVQRCPTRGVSARSVDAAWRAHYFRLVVWCTLSDAHLWPRARKL